MAYTKYITLSRPQVKAMCGEEIYAPRSRAGYLFGPGSDNRHGFLCSFKTEFEARQEADRLNKAAQAAA